MLAINMDDVMNVLGMIKTHLIVLGVVLVLAIVAMVACGKMSKGKKFLVRAQAGLALFLAVVVVANLICTGPMSSMLDLVSETSYLTEETTAEATQLVSKMAEEGIVLLENDNSILPIASGSKLNVFGWASTNPCYGGTGSGALNDAYPTVTLLQGLTDAGIQLNTELEKFYTDYKADRPVVGMWAQDWTLPEPNVSLYTDQLMNNAKAFSDTAMIVITRVGGEGADLPSDMPAVVDGSWAQQGGSANSTYFGGTYDDTLNAGNDWDAGDTYLNLSNREEEMIDLVCSNFDKVVVVFNGANTMELGWVENYSQIQGVIWCPGTGQAGFTGLGKIISGEVNPSGKAADTFVYSFEDTPWWNNFGNFVYDNMDEHISNDTTPTFVNYVEGIYVGYKFYETAAAEGLIDYGKTVQYPFGYGLSYTSFTQEMGPISESNGTITFDVTVTNTGAVAGKDVVEVYFNPPYVNGGIEKASANLVEFAKTGMLEPGASETVTISFPVEDMASYDSKGAGCYVLDNGEYIISINRDSHTVIDSQPYTVGTKVVYNESNKRQSDAVAAVNQFDFADGGVTYLSRANGFANYAAATAAPTNFSMSAESKASFYNINNYLTAEATAMDEDPNAAPITTGAKNGLQLKDLRGLAYDDPKWDQLLDQMTLDDMNTLISLGGYQTNSVDSIGKVRTNDNDGPASINNNFTGVGSVGFPSSVMIASTWNKEMAHDFGDSIGKMANEMNTSGWYAPAMNIHRTAFAGRNFEYYSEDGMLSGAIASNAVSGAKEHGVYSYMKHFALNDQEGNRLDKLCTWSNEQAIREIYLKPFEMCVKDSGCEAVMSSFNYIGNRWAGGCAPLCKTVLRDEWGFVGFVETDYFGVYGYMSADQAIRNGTDLMLVAYQTETNNVRFRETNGAQQAMRESAHNILYVTVNSRAYEPVNYEKATATPVWRTVLIVVDVIAAAAFIGLEYMVLKGYKKREG
jgi:beta-glucosidase